MMDIPSLQNHSPTSPLFIEELDRDAVIDITDKPLITKLPPNVVMDIMETYLSLEDAFSLGVVSSHSYDYYKKCRIRTPLIGKVVVLFEAMLGKTSCEALERGCSEPSQSNICPLKSLRNVLVRAREMYPDIADRLFPGGAFSIRTHHLVVNLFCEILFCELYYSNRSNLFSELQPGIGAVLSQLFPSPELQSMLVEVCISRIGEVCMNGPWWYALRRLLLIIDTSLLCELQGMPNRSCEQFSKFLKTSPEIVKQFFLLHAGQDLSYYLDPFLGVGFFEPVPIEFASLQQAITTPHDGENMSLSDEALFALVDRKLGTYVGEPGSDKTRYLMSALFLGVEMDSVLFGRLSIDDVLSIFSYSSCFFPGVYKNMRKFCLLSVKDFHAHVLDCPKVCLRFLPLCYASLFFEGPIQNRHRLFVDMGKRLAERIKDNPTLQQEWWGYMEAVFSSPSPTSRDAYIFCLLFSCESIPDETLLKMWKTWRPKVREGFLRQLLFYPCSPMFFRWLFISFAAGKGEMLFEQCDGQLVESFRRYAFYTSDFDIAQAAWSYLKHFLLYEEACPIPTEEGDMQKFVTKCLYITTVVLRDSDYCTQLKALHSLCHYFCDRSNVDNASLVAKWRNWFKQQRTWCGSHWDWSMDTLRRSARPLFEKEGFEVPENFFVEDKQRCTEDKSRCTIL